MLHSGQYIEPEQMDAKVALLLGSDNPQNLPASSTAVEAGISQGLGEKDLNNLLPQQQLAALVVLDNVGNRAGGG